MTNEIRKRHEGVRYKEKSEDRGKYRDNRVSKTPQNQQKSTADRPGSIFSDRSPEKRINQKAKHLSPE